MMRFLKEKALPFIKKPHFSFLLVSLFMIVLYLLADSIPPDLFSAIVLTSYYFLAGLGFALLLGYGGLASLGTGAFVGIGAFGLHYVYIQMAMPLLVAIAGAIIIAILVSIVFGFVSLRIAGLYLAIITMGLSQIVIEIIKNI